MTCCCRVYVIFTSLLLVFVSCVGRRGADDSDANVSEDPPYILPLRSSIEAPTMSPPPSPSFGLPPHLPFVSPKCRDQIRPREFHVHFSTCLRNARGRLCLNLPNPSNVCFVHGNVEGGSLHHKKYETFAGETDVEREGETAVSAIAPHGHAEWRKPLDQ